MSITIFKEFPDFSRSNFNIKNYYNTYINSNVVVNASAVNIHYPDHGGPLSIKYVTKGNEYYITNRCKYRVTPENFLVLNQWQSYESYIDSEENVESIAVFFMPKYVTNVLTSLITPKDRLLDYPPGNNSDVHIWFLEKLYKSDKIIIPALLGIRNSLQLKSCERILSEQLYFLLEGLMATHRNVLKETSKVEMVRNSTRAETYRRLSIAKDYIESCFNEDIKLDTLSKAACMNKYYLLRTFKKFYGKTPHQYLKAVRLNEVKKLLINTNKSISEISSIVGFEFLSSLSQAFYQRFKLTPRAYRNLNPSK